MTPPSSKIRRAKPDDYEALARLHFLSHTVSFAPFASDDWLSSRQLDEYLSKWNSALEQAVDDDATMVAMVGTDIVGMCRVSPLQASNYDAQLSSMHVDPELTGNGIGTMLMRQALKFIKERGFDRVQLGVIAANTGARRFYESHGWVVAEEHPTGVEGVPVAVYRLS
ncbi:MAG: GNAT family N-acetyltransferase [Chloroflexi bacterium]|nr:GNAT family N-acetyltransferase [Chloroflexota bacterium]